MSASEKLKALDAEMRVFDAGFTELKVLEALPQIVAVVEAAEENDARFQAAHMNSDFTAALTALGEALS